MATESSGAAVRENIKKATSATKDEKTISHLQSLTLDVHRGPSER